MNNIKIPADELKIIFRLLEIMRANLLKDFLNEDPEIYKPCFKYEKDQILIELSIEKYFISWIDSYWIILDEYFVRKQVIKKVDHHFVHVYLRLLEKWKIEANHVDSSELMKNLLNEKIKILEGMLQLAEKSQAQYNRLQVQYEKDKAIFDRTIQRLNKESHDIS